MLILASPIARTINATEKDAITITAESFAQDCNIKRIQHISHLKKQVRL